MDYVNLLLQNRVYRGGLMGGANSTVTAGR